MALQYFACVPALAANAVVCSLGVRAGPAGIELAAGILPVAFLCSIAASALRSLRSLPLHVGCYTQCWSRNPGESARGFILRGVWTMIHVIHPTIHHIPVFR